MPNTAEDSGLNPFPWYRQMRTSSPVHFDPSSRMWMVFRYPEVQRVLSDHDAFSSASEGGHTSSDPLDASLISLDPPRHRQLRALVTQAFTPRSVAQLSERITGIVTTLLDRVAERGAMDLMDDLATPLPVIVIAELLGIPQEDRARFKAWSDAVVGIQGTGGWPLRGEMSAYFLQMMERRRADPRDDLISALTFRPGRGRAPQPPGTPGLLHLAAGGGQ